MSIDTFKTFARLHPEFAKNVIDNKVSWQKLYEIYEIYGEDSSIWKDYQMGTNLISNSKDPITSFKELISTIRNVDLDSFQKGISNLQKTIGLLQEIGIGSSREEKEGQPKETIYEERPIYRYFED